MCFITLPLVLDMFTIAVNMEGDRLSLRRWSAKSRKKSTMEGHSEW